MIKLYWDSCVFISRLQGDPNRIEVLEYWTDEAANGRAQIFTSTMAIAEVAYLNRDCTEEQMAADVKDILDYFRNDYITVINVTTRIAEDAAAIGRIYRAKPPDAIHIATALFAECAVLHTYDDSRMLKLDDKIAPIRGGGEAKLKIEVPGRNVQLGLKFGGDIELGLRPEESEPLVCGTHRSRKLRPIQRGAWVTRQHWGKPLPSIGR